MTLPSAIKVAERSVGSIAGWALVVAVTVGLVLFALLEPEHALRDGVRDLSAMDRSASLQRTVDELRTTCVAPPPGLQAHCREQAEFALSFSECDDHCRGLAERQLGSSPHPR